MNNCDIHGWFDFAPLYDLVAERSRPGDIIVELGVWHGKSLTYLANLLRDKQCRLFGVDRWRGAPDAKNEYSRLIALYGDPRSCCIRNIEAMGLDGVKLIDSVSWTAADMFADGTVSFVFVDTDHRAITLEKELRAWLPKIKPGGWIAGHDWDKNDMQDGLNKMVPGWRVEHGCWIYEP